ncbi:MAG: VRR-NUC domain-containing protein [Thermomicrobiales bacterium]|nr:VRR-NUC domain-containing protein [Thermomicrobiales bacterium]
MRERDLQAMIVEAAGYLGWRVFHDYDSRHSAPGFPDLILLRPPALLALELKTERGKVRPGQLEWLADLDRVPGVTARLVRPGDLDDVLALLQGDAA